MSDKERSRPVPPYLPWKTFENYIDGLKAFGDHLPNVIDRDSMRNLSGAMQSWLLSGLRALNMIDEHGTPRPRLQQIVQASPDDRKAMYRQVIEAEYPFLREINLKDATPKQIEAAFESTGATGDTVRKCMVFFIGLAKAADVPLSPLISKVRRRAARTNGAAKAVAAKAVVQEQPPADKASLPLASIGQQMKTIELQKSGGTLTLSGSINIFELVEEERELVFSLIDKMKAFERTQQGGTQ